MVHCLYDTQIDERLSKANQTMVRREWKKLHKPLLKMNVNCLSSSFLLNESRALIKSK